MRQQKMLREKLTSQKQVLAGLWRELLPAGPIKKGTLSKRLMRCGNKGCRCWQDPKFRHGPYYWWTTKVCGRSLAVLVPIELVDSYRAYIANYQTLKRAIKRLELMSDRILNTERKLASHIRELKH